MILEMPLYTFCILSVYFLHTFCILSAYFLHTFCIGTFCMSLHTFCILSAYFLYTFCILSAYFKGEYLESRRLAKFYVINIVEIFFFERILCILSSLEAFTRFKQKLHTACFLCHIKKLGEPMETSDYYPICVCTSMYGIKKRLNT